MTTEQKEQIVELYNQGKTDPEIAQIICMSRSRVQQIRKQLGLQTKFTYSKIAKIDSAKFEELFNKGLSDRDLATELGMSYDGIYAHRVRHGYTRESRKEAKANQISEEQLQVLIGTILGDSTMERRSVNANLICGHNSEKAEYVHYKAHLLSSLNPKISEIHQYDKRTNKTYHRTVLRLPANPELNFLYESFYKPKKVIPIELLSHFSALSLAILFMDDGCGNKNYTIATMCFERQQVEKFAEFLTQKFGLSCSVLGNNILYIKACSRNLFTQIVSPYMCDCMKYKLIQS